jgi:dTDP-4-amino-4,6-dideoxygalactose transaminase
MMITSVPFIDLQAQRRRLGASIDDAISRVFSHGAYVLGPEIIELEQKLAEFAGVRHALACSSGTDALVLSLLALNVRPGDRVAVPAFTFTATAEAVAFLGAEPIFVDVDDKTFNIDPMSLSDTIEASRGDRLVGIIPVDLFGQPAEHEVIASLAADAGLWVLDDAAQSFGATLEGRLIGGFGRLATTSFFPAKPLGCYGDGGAVFTDDDSLAAAISSFRNHGAGTDRYDNVRIGMNGRLDTIQAAILLEKLAIFPDELVARQKVADRYRALLREPTIAPELRDGATSTWAQYTVRVPNRDEVARRLGAEGIPTAVYYRTPLHHQAAYRHFPSAPGGLPVTDRLAADVLSLPMHPYLDEATQDRIVEVLHRAVGA